MNLQAFQIIKMSYFVHHKYLWNQIISHSIDSVTLKRFKYEGPLCYTYLKIVIIEFCTQVIVINFKPIRSNQKTHLSLAHRPTLHVLHGVLGRLDTVVGDERLVQHLVDQNVRDRTVKVHLARQVFGGHVVRQLVHPDHGGGQGFPEAHLGKCGGWWTYIDIEGERGYYPYFSFDIFIAIGRFSAEKLLI